VRRLGIVVVVVVVVDVVDVRVVVELVKLVDVDVEGARPLLVVVTDTVFEYADNEVVLKARMR